MNNTRQAWSRNAPMIFAMMIVLVIASLRDLEFYWDQAIRKDQWITAEIEVVPVVGERPLIRYRPLPVENFAGEWKAWVRTSRDKIRINGGDGTGTYSPNVPKARLWSWEAFFEKDFPEPLMPYEVCVSYSGALMASGAKGAFGPFCSAPHDPRAEVPQ